ncbi:MAG: methyltransferase type 12, partial [Verrucomicrobia bacterium]|nr:methyltransferase type 12 [Verrucomicrobiota bacterium]
LLARLPELVKAGGELVLTTPCTWLEEFTTPGHWPPAGTREWLEAEVGGSFELVEERDEAFLIRETARKFQWTVALLTKWRRR